MAQVYINRRELADGDIQVPLTFQTQDIQNLDSRMANFSLSGILPDTPRNHALVAHVNEIAGVGTYAYIKVPCSLVEKGQNLIGSNGYMIINRYVKGSGFDCSFYSGNFDFFEAAKALRLRTLTIASPQWNATEILANGGPSGNNIFWPVINWHMGESSYWDNNIGGPYGAIDLRFLYPVIKGDYLMDLVEAALAYTFVNQPTTDTMIPMVSQLANANVETELSSGYLEDWGGISLPFMQNNIVYDWYMTESADPHLQWSTSVYNAVSYGHYRANTRGKYRLRYVGRIKNLGTLIGGNDEDIEIGAYFVNFPNGVYDGTQTYDGFYSEIINIPYGTIVDIDVQTPWTDIEELDKVVICPHGMSNSVYMQVWSQQFTIEADVDNTIYNYEFPIAENLPDWSAWDFIKAYCQFCHLIPYVDYYNRTVTFVSYADIYAKVPAGTFYDWSEKFDRSENHEISYSMDFAKTNWMKFKTDSCNLTEGFADASFLISDLTLPETKDVITSEFAATEETIHFNEQVKVARIRRSDETGVVAQDYEPRIMKWIQRTADIVLETPNYMSPLLTNWYTGTMEDWTWTDLLTDNYSELTSLVLNQTKLLKVFINLTALDIANLDLTKPVYIKAFGRFFIINKINNYLPGKSTEVELIRM